MKYYTRAKIYKSSNVIFKPDLISATSYDWWHFVKVIKGKVVFNNYRYSVSTSKHQRKVKSLMESLGIKIDLVVSTKESLSKFDRLVDVKRAHKEQQELDAKIKELNRVSRNKRAREKRIALRAQATVDRVGLRVIEDAREIVESINSSTGGN